MGVPVQIGVHELMGVPEHTIKMNQKLGKVMGGWVVGAFGKQRQLWSLFEFEI